MVRAGKPNLDALDRQFLTLVSQHVLANEGGDVDLRQVGHVAADLLNVDFKTQGALQKLLGTWTDPVRDAQKFVAQLRVDLGAAELAIDEPKLLQRIGQLGDAVKTAPVGVPDDPSARPHVVHTAAAWNDSFIRLSKNFVGIEPGVDAREYCFPGGKAMVERLIDHLGIKAGDRVYNPGSGEGGEARHMARMGVHVTGVDISDVGCAVADRQNADAGLSDRIRIIQDDILKAPLADGSFDHIMAPDCDGIHYSADRDELFGRFFDQLKSGGRLAISMYLPGEGTEKDVCDAFDKSMAWAGFEPKNLNADAYKKQLEAAGFVDVEIIPLGDVYMDWHQQAMANVEAQGRKDPWMGEWIELAKQAPNGFGFMVSARKPDGL